MGRPLQLLSRTRAILTPPSGSGECLTVLGRHGPVQRFPWDKPWDRQPVSGKLRRKLGVSPGFATHRGPPPPKRLSTHVEGRSEIGEWVMVHEKCLEQPDPVIAHMNNTL